MRSRRHRVHEAGTTPVGPRHPHHRSAERHRFTGREPTCSQMGVGQRAQYHLVAGHIEQQVIRSEGSVIDTRTAPTGRPTDHVRAAVQRDGASRIRTSDDAQLPLAVHIVLGHGSDVEAASSSPRPDGSFDPGMVPGGARSGLGERPGETEGDAMTARVTDTVIEAVRDAVTAAADARCMTRSMTRQATITDRTSPTRLVPPSSTADRRSEWQRRPGSMATRLQDQWDDLVDSPSAVRRARQWFDPSIVHPSDISSLDDVLALVGFQGAREDVAADGRLLHLVTIAQHDDLAARVVLQRILPGLLSIAARRGRLPGLNGPGVFSEIAATAWTLICTYPVERRPAKVAANLLRDVEYETFVRRQRMRAWRDETCVERLPEPMSPREKPAVEQIVTLLRDARDAGLHAHDLRFLAELASGRHPEELGASLGCSPRTVRTRRRVLTRVLHRFVNGEDVTWPSAPARFYAAWDASPSG